MKAGFEIVYGSSLDQHGMIQTHEPWTISPTRPPCLILNQRNELSDWVEQITKQLIDDDNDDSANGSFPTLNQNNSNHHNDNDNDHNDNINHHVSDPQGMNLMTLLFESAVAISVDNLGGAHQILLELSEMASPYAPSCAERVVAYFAQAMSTRVINSSLGLGVHNNVSGTTFHYNVIKNRSDCHNYQNSLRESLRAFNDVAPFLKFAHFTSNQAILEAVHLHPFVHVIDLDFLHVGLFHWPALLHGLATRPEGPPSHVRLTALGASDDLHSDAGKHLSSFAKRLGISFEFTPLGSDINISELRTRIGRNRDEHREALAVHLLRHCLYDGNGSSDWKTMRLVEELRPRIFTLVEQDMASHGGAFLDRFVGSLHYYSTVFDALGMCLGTDDEKRNMVESGMLYREIRNVLGVGRRGDDDHQERIVGGSWRREMAARGCLAQVAMSGNAAAQAQLIVNMFGGGGYRMLQGDGTIRLGWKETSLYTVSAWTSISTSSSYVHVSR